MNINGATFVITGGGSGLGEATARLFVESGANVVLADLNKENADKVAADLGDKARAIECNVTDETQVQAAVDLALGEFDGLNGSINCAGIGAAQRTTSKKGPYPIDMFKFIIDVNLIGTFNAIRLCAHAMSGLDPDANGERGVFVNTASVAAFEGQIGQAAAPKALRGDENVGLSKQTAELMTTSVGLGSYGLGLTIGGNGEIFGHGGSNWGFKCNLVAHMKQGYGYVAMTNGDNGSRVVSELQKRIRRAYGWDAEE